MALYILKLWQALVLKEFTSLLIILVYAYFFACILSTLFSLTMVGDPSAWKLRLDIGLIAILFSAFIGAAFRITLFMWCLKRTGPLYVSMFTPLGIVFSTIIGVIILGDGLSLGSLIGGVIILAGFYAVVWGKSKEAKDIEQSEIGNFRPSSEQVPLSQDRIEEINSRSSV